MAMSSFTLYLLKVSLNLFIVWGIWFLALRRANRFALVRAFLLVGVACAMLLPCGMQLIPFKPVMFSQDTGGLFSFTLPEVIVGAAPYKKGIDWSGIIPMVFMAITALFLLRFIFQLLRMVILFNQGTVRKEGGLYIVDHHKSVSPFSFLNYCFINPDQIPPNRIEGIIAHERAHSRMGHSVDILFMELAGLVQWFNPFYWMVRRSLVEVHEFQADNVAMKYQDNFYAYIDSIVSLAFGGITLPLGNNFSKSLTLKRLAMMNIKRTTKGDLGRWMLALLIAIPLIFAISCSNETMREENDLLSLSSPPPPPPPPPPENIKTSDIDEVGEDIFVIVEQMPTFQGEPADKFREFLAANLRYPVIAAENGIQGKVYVSFVIDTDGSVSRVKVKKGVDPSLDKEAIRVVETSPRWEPGIQKGQTVRVEFTFPIIFVLAEDDVVN